MVFRRNRARSRFTAVALLLLASFCAGPFVLPHADPLGDVACNAPGSISHEESSHQLGGPTTVDGDHQEHCVLCHLVRISCSLLLTGEQVKVSPAGAERLHGRTILPPTRHAWSLGPGRAPPV